ncbi:hypothetical protein [Streptomyces sp. ME109]|uniref:hypothetical protein n=1 Tax=Streptomyces sp. me109 TaxID=1827853 RepID=UPI0016519B4E|nr:hypothetical protein [Streptomyces sp. me109]
MSPNKQKAAWLAGGFLFSLSFGLAAALIFALAAEHAAGWAILVTGAVAFSAAFLTVTRVIGLFDFEERPSAVSPTDPPQVLPPAPPVSPALPPVQGNAGQTPPNSNQQGAPVA